MNKLDYRALAQTFFKNTDFLSQTDREDSLKELLERVDRAGYNRARWRMLNGKGTNAEPQVPEPTQAQVEVKRNTGGVLATGSCLDD